MSKVLDELHKIREENYENEKNLTKEKKLENLHERVNKILKKENLNLNRLEKEPAKV